MIKNGKFKHTDTLPSLKFESFLQDLDISYEKEKLESYWSFDFYLKDLNIYIEVDGDYFHSNPKLYNDGPKTKTQKVNYYRDKRKNEYCINNNINLIRFWESDILGDEECVKQKLSELKKLD
jgi:very-short-patch-repair endonuclease